MRIIFFCHSIEDNFCRLPSSFLNLDKSVLTISEADTEGDSLASRETSYNTLNEAKDKLQKTIRVKFDQVMFEHSSSYLVLGKLLYPIPIESN